MKELDTEKLESKENVKYVGSLRMLRNPNSPNYGYQQDAGDFFYMWRNSNNQSFIYRDEDIFLVKQQDIKEFSRDISSFGYKIGEQTQSSYLTGGKISALRIGSHTTITITPPSLQTDTYNLGCYSIPFKAYKFNHETNKFEKENKYNGIYYINIAEHDKNEVSNVIKFLLEAEVKEDEETFLEIAQNYITQFEKIESFNPIQWYVDNYCGGEKSYVYMFYMIIIFAIIMILAILTS